MKSVKRILAMVIAAVMIVTSLPMDSVRLNVQAETGDVVENEDSISDNNGTGDGSGEQPGDQEQQDTYGACILEAADYEVAKGDLGRIFDAEKYQNAWICNNSLAELLNTLAENKAEYAVIQHYQDLDMESISIPETMKGLILNSGWDNENQREYSATISEIALEGYDTELYLMGMNINCIDTTSAVRFGFLPEEISPTLDANISNNSTVIFSNCTVNGAVVTYNVAGETEETIGKIGFTNCNEIAGYDGAATTSVVGDWAELRLRTPSKLVFHDITGNANLNIYYNGYDVELIPQFHGSIDLGMGEDENGNSYVNNIHVRYLEPCTDEAQNQIPAWDLEEGNGTPWQDLATDVALKEGDRVYIPGTENKEDVARVCRYERQYQEGEMALVANEEGFLVQEQQGGPGFDDNILYQILTISKEEYDTVKENTGLIWGYFDEETQELVPSIFEGREWIIEEAGDNSRSLNLALSQLEGYAIVDVGRPFQMNDSLVIPEAVSGILLFGGSNDGMIQEMNSMVVAGSNTEVVLKDFNVCLPEASEGVPSFKIWFEQGNSENNSNVVIWDCYFNGILEDCVSSEDTTSDVAPLGTITFRGSTGLSGYEGAKVTAIEDWAELRVAKPGKLNFNEISGNADLNLNFDGYDAQNIPSFAGPISLTGYDAESQVAYTCGVHLRFLKPYINEEQEERPAWEMSGEDAEGNWIPWPEVAEDVELEVGTKVIDIVSTENTESILETVRYEKNWKEGEEWLAINEEGCLVIGGSEGFYSPLLRVLSVTEEDYNAIMEDMSILWGQGEGDSYQPSKFDDQWVEYQYGDINRILSSIDASYVVTEFGKDVEGTFSVPSQLKGIMFLGGWNGLEQRQNIQLLDAVEILGTETEVMLHNFMIEAAENDAAGKFAVGFLPGENNSSITFSDCTVRKVISTYALANSDVEAVTDEPVGTVLFRYANRIAGYEGAKVTGNRECGELLLDAPGPLYFNEIKGQENINIFVNGYHADFVPVFAGPIDLGMGYNEEEGFEYRNSVQVRYLKYMEEPAWNKPYEEGDIPWPEVVEDEPLSVGTQIIRLATQDAAVRENILEHCEYNRFWKENEEWLGIDENGCLAESWYFIPRFGVIALTEKEYTEILSNWDILWGHEDENGNYVPSKFEEENRWVEGNNINELLASLKDAEYIIVCPNKDYEEAELIIPENIKEIQFDSGWNEREQRPVLQNINGVTINGKDTKVYMGGVLVPAGDSSEFRVGFLPGENNSSITFTDCTVRKVISTYALANSEGEAVTDVPVGTVLFRYANRIAGYEGAKVTVNRECAELLLDAPGPLYFNEIKGQENINIFVNGYHADFVPVFAGPIDLGMGYNEEEGFEYRNSVQVRYLKYMEEPAWNKPYEEGDIPWSETVEDEALSVGAQIIRLATQDATVRENILEHCEYNRFWKENEEWLGIDENGCLADSWYFIPRFGVIALTEKEYTEILSNWDILWGHEDENGNYVPSKFEEENRWVEGNNINELLASLKDAEYIIVCPNKDYEEAELIIPENIKAIHFDSGWNEREQRPVLQNINGVTINGKDTKVYMGGVLVPAGDSSEFRVGFQPEGNAKLVLENVNIERTLVAYSLGTEATAAVGQVQIKFDVELRGYVGVKTTCVEEFGRILISNPDRVIINDLIGDGWFNLVYNGYDATKLPVLMGKVDLGQGFDEQTGESGAYCMSIRYLKKQDIPAWRSQDLWESLWESPIDEVLQKGAKVVDFGQHSEEEIDQLLEVVRYMTNVSEYMGYFIDETGCLTYERIVNIFFNTMGGNEIEPLQVVSGGYLTVEDPVREGYIFEGWYCDVECQIPYENWGIWEDTTFYAKWKAVPNSQGIHVECVTSYTYTGSKITPYVAVYDGDMELIKGVDYTVKYLNNVNASASLTDIGVDKTGYDASKQPMIQIVGKGNYTVSYEIPFEIYAKDICNDDMEINMVDAYEVPKKGDLKVSLTVKDGKKTLGKDKDYVVEYLDESGKVLSNADISKEGFYVLRISGKSGSNYSGTVERFFMVTSSLIPLSKAKVTIDSKARKMEYTGEEITLPANAVTVKVGSETLTEGKDYCVEYADNWEVGKAKVYIVPMDSEDCKYCGTTSAEFEIIGTPIKKVIIENFESSLPYTGDEVFQEDMVLKAKDGKELVLGRDYWVVYDKNVNAGSATATIYGMAGYTGSVKKKFKITPVELKADMCTDEEILAVYSASGAKPDITLFYNDMLLENGRDYTLSYSNNKKVAKADDEKAPTITVKGKGNYKGTIKAIKKFTICPQPLVAQNVVVEDMVFVANKADTFAYKPKLTVFDNGKKIAAKNYTVQYSGNIQGDIKEALSTEQTVEAKVVIKMTEGNASYSGECEVPFRITPKALKKAKLISAIPDQIYTGNAITLEAGVLKVKDASGNTLTEGVDFIIDSYAANVKTTKAAKVTIKGIGKYSGTATFKFKIVGKKLK